MYAFRSPLNKDFCTHVAKQLVNKSKFMKDVGTVDMQVHNFACMLIVLEFLGEAVHSVSRKCGRDSTSAHTP